MPRWNPEDPYQDWRVSERSDERAAGWREDRPASRGPKGWRRTDERILDELCERIARSGVDASDLEVKVEKGVVTLRGRARSRDERRHVEAIAEHVLGVEEVDDRVVVGSPPPEETAGAGTGTTGTGLTMSARQAGARAPSQRESPPPRRR